MLTLQISSGFRSYGKNPDDNGPFLTNDRERLLQVPFRCVWQTSVCVEPSDRNNYEMIFSEGLLSPTNPSSCGVSDPRI